jgi:ribulose 1,5-bisphosphate synthetase/thiazole synthase
MLTFTKQIPVLTPAAVIVVGSGSAGATAAIAAGRWLHQRGHTEPVVLIERHGFAGGTSTAVLDTFYGFYTPGSVSKKVVGGVPDDVVHAVAELDCVIERPNTFGAGTGITYNPEFLKVAWERLASGAGARISYHTMFVDVLEENGRVAGVVVANKAGLAAIPAAVVVDASGDADVCARAGVSFERAGEIEPGQTLTTTFRLANVDAARARAFPRTAMVEKMKEAADSGRYELPRREGSIHITPIESVMATIMTRLADVDATDPEQLSAAEIAGRAQALEYERFLRDFIPGYENARIVAFSAQIGVRETRRVYGRYRLTRQDVLSAARFPDVIGLCGAPIEDHHAGQTTRWTYLPEGETVDIPYRALVPRDGLDGLLVAGRCFSATHDAHASVRSMAQCMAMGQAAGLAAALSFIHNLLPGEVNIHELQTELRAIGAVLETPGKDKQIADASIAVPGDRAGHYHQN